MAFDSSINFSGTIEFRKNQIDMYEYWWIKRRKLFVICIDNNNFSPMINSVSITNLSLFLFSTNESIKVLTTVCIFYCFIVLKPEYFSSNVIIIFHVSHKNWISYYVLPLSCTSELNKYNGLRWLSIWFKNICLLYCQKLWIYVIKHFWNMKNMILRKQ